MSVDAVRGTGALLRLALRRDRVVLPVWMLVYLLYSVGGTAAAVALYPDVASRVEAADAVNRLPAMLLMYGRVWDPQGLGSVAMMKPIGFGGVFAAILGILFMTRHTRAEEEAGRTELVSALPVGRWAHTVASLSLAALVMALLSVVDAVGVTAMGLPAASAWAWAVSVSLTGSTFAALAALTAQLTASARAANVLALIGLTASFLLRGTADAAGTSTTSAWWTWLSPIGWQDQVRAFAGDRWTPMPLFVIAIVALIAAAITLASRRDVGAGLLPERSGRAHASALLASPLALTLRLQRGLLIGLFAAYLALSLLLGAIASSSQQFLDSAGMRDWLLAITGTGDPYTAFLVFELGFAALMTALCGIVLARRLTTEEQAGRLDAILATAVARNRVFRAHTVTALGATLVLQCTLAVGFSLARGTAGVGTSGNGIGLPTLLGMTLVSLPAIWALTALALSAIGAVPRLSMIAWFAFAGSILIAEFGPLLHWPSLVMDLSPFTHVPRIPVAPMTWTPVVLLLTLTAALLGFGAARFRARDLAN